jgi:hypothetical protein
MAQGVAVESAAVYTSSSASIHVPRPSFRSRNNSIQQQLLPADSRHCWLQLRPAEQEQKRSSSICCFALLLCFASLTSTRHPPRPSIFSQPPLVLLPAGRPLS